MAGHDAGAPVDLAVALAAQVSAAHADAVAALARLLADPGQHAWLHQAGTPGEPRPLPRAHGRPAAVA
ncbi:PTS sugar transporter, partial [Streptomyces diastaticus]